tara:strand:- start:5516 stop:6427 length:912 start_codon:yes stop_codon:yes gene_type:complete
MAFLDNSGDIILDAVLTDTGRFRLAKGDGSFKITKFALGDDEIDYALYNKNHPSGSAYYDLELLQTPVLEAFTNNTSMLKSKLVSIPRTNLLYLPVMKLNEIYSTNNARHTTGAYLVAVNKDTEEALGVDASSNAVSGIMYGENVGAGTTIRVDQGLDTSEISPAFTIDADLVETQYIVEFDNRFGSIVNATNGSITSPSFIDDDNIATYFFSLGTDIGIVSENTERDAAASTQTIQGPRGTYIEFQIQSSLDLNTGTFLFTELGSTTTVNSTAVYYIDTTVRITGATTGYRIDVPVRLVRKQ